jgi:2-polyprenyl-6-methoxyphenol hydroxylase-like FAD-dependent oxidoreductase
MLTLFGFLGDRPPTDPEGFAAFARSLRFPDLHDAVRGGEAIDDPMAFRVPANVRRRYERIRHFPEGFLVMGDAVCSFNPVYGQGMTVAALQAVALRRCLEDGDPRLAHRFFSAAANPVDHAWNMATGADLALPGVDGPRTLQVRLANAYMGRLLAVAAHDPSVATAFVRAVGMVDPLSSLLHPAIAVRVLRAHAHPGGLARRRRGPVGSQLATNSARSQPTRQEAR